MTSNDCVETARLDPVGRTIGIRDSKDTSGRVIAVALVHWRVLVCRIKRGHYDRP